jgi:hypothetical protein
LEAFARPPAFTFALGAVLLDLPVVLFFDAAPAFLVAFVRRAAPVAFDAIGYLVVRVARNWV